MTKEEKQILLRDLSARLPYGVKCQTKNGIGTLISIECSFGENLVYVDFDRSEAEEYDLNDGDTVKPYLRPMSSMTDKERRFLLKYGTVGMDENDKVFDVYPYGMERNMAVIDFLNEHHFDYRNLIEKGLAIVAPEGMYKNE